MTEPAPTPPARRRLRGLAIVAAVVVLAVTLVAALATGSDDAEVPGLATGGDEAPAFSLENVLEGEPAVTLAAFRGRPLVVNFWASWCAPCAKEMPEFEAVYQRVKDRIAFVGIDGNDSRRNAVRLIDETGVTYPSGYDPTDEVYRDYRVLGRPTTVFVDAAGRIAARHAGELRGDQLQALLDELF